MSGEAVVLIGASAGVAGVAVAAGTALVAARMVAEWVQEQRSIAEREMRRERERTAAWQAFHREEQQALERMTRRREAVRSTLENLRLTRPEEPAVAGGTDRNRGFVTGERTEMVDLLRSVQFRLPAEASTPLQRLEGQARELDRRLASPLPPQEETLRSFRQTVRGTVAQLLETVEQESAARRRLLERVEALLGDALAYRRLAQEPDSDRELAGLQEHLVRLLTTGEAAAAGVELLESRLQGLKARIDGELEQAAIRAVLEERVQHHLEALGYRRRGPDVWAIPGGEQVRVALQPGNRLAFQLAHERPEAVDRPLGGEELAFLRAQEQRWCSDLHGLLGSLQADGFEFQVQLERETPEEAIPIVVVDDVDEWDAAAGAREAPQRRHLT